MAEYTITAVGGMKPWTGDHGTFHIYDIEWDGPEAGKGSIKQKDSTPAPTVGMTLDAEVVKRGDFPPELKRVPKGAGGFNGGGGRSPMPPSKEAEIRRLACQKSGVALLVAEVQLGKHKEGTVSDLLKARIDWLEQDCIEAGKRASSA